MRQKKNEREREGVIIIKSLEINNIETQITK